MSENGGSKARWLCRLGLHSWKLSDGKGVTIGQSARMAIFYAKDCRHCGKHHDAVMIA